MNDAPPVTSAVFPAQNDSVVATPRLPPDSLARPDVFENFQIFLKLGHSIIGGCGGPCRRFHRLQLPPVRHQVPDHADEFPWLSGSAATAKPCFTPSDRTSLSRGATATIGFPAARIPYILLGTTTPSSPRFTVTMCASAAAKTEGICAAGK